MAEGIKTEKDIKRARHYKKLQEAKRKQFCFSDEDVFKLVHQLRAEKRLVFAEPDDHEALRVNITRLLLKAHSANIEKYVYPEQLSEFLGIGLSTVKALLPSVKKGLVEVHGYTLRNKHGVGYRIADYRDVLLETDKSIARLTGIDINAINRAYASVKSLKLTKNKPQFAEQWRAAQSNFLTELRQSIDDIEREKEELVAEYPEFKMYLAEVKLESESGPSL